LWNVHVIENVYSESANISQILNGIPFNVKSANESLAGKIVTVLAVTKECVECESNMIPILMHQMRQSAVCLFSGAQAERFWNLK
jgi:hypothetical protein